MVNKEKLLLAAIDLTDGHEKSFTDLELSKKLHVPRDEINIEIDYDEQMATFLEKIPKKKIICDSCGKEVEVFPDIKKAYCICKKSIDKEEIPYWDYCINNKELENHYINKLKGSFETTEEENNRLILKMNGEYITILVTTHQARLEDYYLLKGWAKNSNFYVIISGFFDFLLSSHQDKTSDLALKKFNIFYEGDFKNQFKRIMELIKGRKKEEGILSQFDPKEKRDLSEIRKYWEKIVEELPTYALQSGEENPKVQGDMFEEHVINLLGLTIFNVWHIGGPDNADGIILVYFHGKNKSNLLYPLEVKSFKPKDGKKICRLKDHEDQLKRYLGGYTSDAVTKLFSVNSILIIAYDFDLENETDKNVIKRIKKDFGIDVILIPLRSLIRLVKLYFEKKISSIDPDIIENLLSNNYIVEDNVEKALDEMKIRSDREADHIIQSAKEQIKRSP